MFRNIMIILFITSICGFCQAQTETLQNHSAKKIEADLSTDTLSESIIEPLQSFGFVSHVPNDLWKIAKSPFEKNNLKGLSIVAGTTALFLWQDQNLVNGVQQFGRSINLSPQTTYSVPIKFGGTRILKIPSNLNTAIYELGEGGTSMYIAGGLFLYGKINHDRRSLQTASDLTESFLSMGIFTQVLKRISGRQTPSSSNQNGGYWDPFPSFSNFKNNVANFDSFPSGHLATMMATVTVLTENYPQKKWLKPVGYSLTTLTGLAMMNNGVHWIGDYPLAIALGYISGEITVNRHKKKYNPIIH
jgi:hypothetical protein